MDGTFRLSLSLSLMHTFIICLQCKNSHTNEHSHPPTIPLSFAHPSYSLHTRFQWSAQCVLCVYKQLPYEVIAKVEDTAETIITKIKITQVWSWSRGSVTFHSQPPFYFRLLYLQILLLVKCQCLDSNPVALLRRSCLNHCPLVTGIKTSGSLVVEQKLYLLTTTFSND